MLDNFREWLSDNLRYILLGLAGILLLVIAFFAIRLVTSIGSPKQREPETQQVSTEGMTTAETDQQRTASTLVRNESKVLDLMTRYFTARANKDYDALTTMSEVFNETDRTAIEAQDALVEYYSNIMTYSKPGMTEGSYVAYVYYDVKLNGVNTLAPSLRDFYLTANTDGSLVIADMDSHPDQLAFIEQQRTDADVQALRSDVDKKYNDALSQDDALKQLVDPDNAPATPQTDQSGDGMNGDNPVVGTETGIMQATTEVNVRSEASVDGTLYGVLTTGTSVEVLENLDSGWSKIRYTVNGTTIEGYVMSQYLTSVQ